MSAVERGPSGTEAKKESYDMLSHFRQILSLCVLAGRWPWPYSVDECIAWGEGVEGESEGAGECEVKKGEVEEEGAVPPTPPAVIPAVSAVERGPSGTEAKKESYDMLSHFRQILSLCVLAGRWPWPYSVDECIAWGEGVEGESEGAGECEVKKGEVEEEGAVPSTQCDWKVKKGEVEDEVAVTSTQCDWKSIRHLAHPRLL